MMYSLPVEWFALESLGLQAPVSGCRADAKNGKSQRPEDAERAT